MFWRDKKLKSEEFEIILKRTIMLEAICDSLQKKIDSTNTALASLRGLVNRKLGGKSDDDSGNEEPMGSSLKDDGFNYLRK